jgi:hypothetical protein
MNFFFVFQLYFASIEEAVCLASRTCTGDPHTIPKNCKFLNETGGKTPVSLLPVRFFTHGDQTEWFFANWATFGHHPIYRLYEFWQDEVTPKSNILGYFLLQQICYIFAQISGFKT